MVLPRNTSIFALLILAVLALPVAAETILLDFSSAACMPCRQMRPVVEQLKQAGYRVQEISIDRQPQIAARYGVTRVPTFIVVNDNRETSRLTGRTTFAQLKQMLDHGGANLLDAQNPNNAPVVALGQGGAPTAPTQDLTTPQAGRFVEIAPPASQPTQRPTANPFPTATSGQAAAVSGSASLQQKLIEATVKLSVDDPEGTSAGTGTLVDARGGEALVLTCGHIFRSSQGKGPITVTLYQLGSAGAEVRTTLPGNLIHYDLNRDLALVSIRPDVPVAPIAVGSRQVSLTAGAPVVSLGCNTGNNPTAVSSKITMVDRYQGFSNVEVAGAPIQGRSGGGLFNAQGQLIGVCNAADPQGNEGLYASLPSIHEKFDELKLSMIYQGRQATPQSPLANPAAMLAAQPLPDNVPVEVRGQNAIEHATTAPVAPAINTASVAPPVTQVAASVELSPTERAALQEITARAAQSEVICIVRPQSPDGKSEVIKLQGVSPAFVEALNKASASSGPSNVGNRTAAAPAAGNYR